MELNVIALAILALPALGALSLLIAGPLADKGGHWFAVAMSGGSFIASCWLFIAMVNGQMIGNAGDAVYIKGWLPVANGIDFGLKVDQLSILFALLVTGVGTVIHVYSVGYMAHDPRRRRFFAFLNLFILAMLLLVLADNYLVLFIGWEGVGLASYLLIGFWQHKPSAAAAAKKAFVMNRIGDLGLTMGIFTLLAQVGSVNFNDVNAAVGSLDHAWVIALGFFFLLAACGKSAQFPLQAWLLDAMEGPTPVSALIHAATMVTAGVYLVVRSGAIYELTPEASLAVVIVALITIFFGAWIGSSKDDIKKVLAGSTMSQIGYMLLAAGIGPAGWAFAIFHLLTHGFFKANMFLGAGSIMHGTNDDVNMRHFGALYKVMPYTFVTFGLGYLAIIGIPPLAGYFSKDHIITAAFEKGTAIGVLALLGAGVTAFYMTRLMLMTFFGKARWVDGVTPHESPKIMTVPLIILAFFSVIGGVLFNGWIQGWLAPAVGNEVHDAEWLPAWEGLVTLVVVLAGVAIAWLLFGKKPVPAEPPETLNPLVIAGRHDLFQDDVNNAVVVKPVMLLAKAVNLDDTKVIDKGLDLGARAVLALSQFTRGLQNGKVRSYALLTVFGVILIGVLTIIGQRG
jgi:NADH-quinone oxidoreductase subunit L